MQNIPEDIYSVELPAKYDIKPEFMIGLIYFFNFMKGF